MLFACRSSRRRTRPFPPKLFDRPAMKRSGKVNPPTTASRSSRKSARRLSPDAAFRATLTTPKAGTSRPLLVVCLIACLYLPNGNPQPGPKFDYKLAWFDRLIAHARTLFAEGVPAILAGDFNVVPTDLDIYPTQILGRQCFNATRESRRASRSLLKQGWIDAIRTRHPDQPMYTFWDYKRNRWARDAGLRIDQLLLSPNLRGRLVDAGVDKWVRGEDGASDHAPAWLVLKDRPKRDAALTSKSGKPNTPSTPVRCELIANYDISWAIGIEANNIRATNRLSCGLKLQLPHVLPFESVCTLRCLRRTLYHRRSFQSWLPPQWL